MKRLEFMTHLFANRRSEHTGIEQLFEFEAEELAAIERCRESFPDAWSERLRQAGVKHPNPDVLQTDDSASAARLFSHWFSATTILLQQQTGHQVSETVLIPGEKPNQYRAWFEFEDSDVGVPAYCLALRLVTGLIPGLNQDPIRSLFETDDDIGAQYSAFAELARQRILPHDTQAIINACKKLDIPCVKLDREPYEGVTGGFRIRNNGLLKLGHACHTRVVDGTVSIDRSDAASPLLNDRQAQFARLQQLAMPVPAQDPVSRNINSPGRAMRAAEKLTYPVTVKPVMRNSAAVTTVNISSPEAMTAAVRNAQHTDRRVIVEKHISGDRFTLIIAGHRMIGALAANGEQATSRVHPSLVELSTTLSGAIGFGLLVLTVVSKDISLPLRQSGGAIVDIDPAPQLDAILPPDSALMALAAEHFVRWIYPPGSVSRIPVISVTGTNGKTTTTRMLVRIMKNSGYHTGAALTDGVLIDDVLVEEGDLAGVPGHLRVFESAEVDCAVLETAMGALTDRGLLFDWCNVALCTNISSDHLGPAGIRTLQQLADLKRITLECARDAVVLNADDPYCLGMVPGLQAKHICLVSAQNSPAELRQQENRANCFCVLEETAGNSHIVLYREDERIDVCAVNDIPATLNGHAGFNTSNAQHAIAAGLFAGAGIDAVRDAICGFEMNIDDTPGRLNVYDELPFRIIMDYAHNPGGMTAIAEMVACANPEGRKAILFAAPGDRNDQEILDLAYAASGSYDHYYVRSYPRLRGRQPGEVTQMLKQGLLESGVPAECITAVSEPTLAVDQVLSEARPGDLVVITASKKEFASNWEKFQDFKFEDHDRDDS